MRYRSAKRGFTLIELLVVIAIIAILAAILFPVFMSAKTAAARGGCMGHLKQLGAGFKLYQQDYSDFPSCGYYPNPPDNTGENWGYTLWVKMLKDTYVKSTKVFACPGATGMVFPEPVKGHVPSPRQDLSYIRIAYSYNEYIYYRNRYSHNGRTVNFYNESLIREPKNVLLIADGHSHALIHDWRSDSDSEFYYWQEKTGLPDGLLRLKYADGLVGFPSPPVDPTPSDYQREPRVRHGGSNVLFADLHAKTVLPDDIKIATVGGITYESPVVFPSARPYVMKP